ncbi:MAG TPA: ABC transporter permease [bacterium]|nr:ABC transporter permease [bacterium]
MSVLSRPEAVPGAPETVRPSRRLPRWGSLPGWLRRSVIVAVILAAWQAYVSISQVNPLLIRGPIDVGQALWSDIVIRHTLPPATLATLRVLLLGMLVGTTGALVLSTLASLSDVGQDILSTLSSMLNPLPAIAILPLATLWLGLTTQALVLVIVHATLWPVALNTTMGFRTVNRTIHMVGRNLGLKGVRMVLLVLLPAALPHILTGLKMAWAFGWRTIIAAELVFGVAGAKGGLGWYINESKTFLDIDKVFAGLVVIAAIGIVIELIFGLIERQTVQRWGMKTL